MQLRIEHTTSRSADPLKEFAPEPAPVLATPPRFDHSVPGTPDHTHGRLLTLASAAAIMQAPLVAMWLMGVPSPLATPAPPAGTTASPTAAEHTAEAALTRNERTDGVAFVTPSHATGALRITTQPAGSPVTLDGVYRGRAPLLLANVTAGVHLLVAQLGGRPVERAVSVATNAVVPVLVTAPVASPSESRGRLLVESSTPLQVREDGSFIGATNGPSITLSAGEHLLEFGDDSLGFRVERRVNVTADTITHVAVDVPHAPLVIDAQPWAEVWVDGTPVGTTPLMSLTWPIGRRQVRIRHPEFGERLITVLVTRNAAARVDVDLRAN